MVSVMRRGIGVVKPPYSPLLGNLPTPYSPLSLRKNKIYNLWYVKGLIRVLPYPTEVTKLLLMLYAAIIRKHVSSFWKGATPLIVTGIQLTDSRLNRKEEKLRAERLAIEGREERDLGRQERELNMKLMHKQIEQLGNQKKAPLSAATLTPPKTH
ncbi:hypothetical protein L873DRAFT_191294 [Choiromyces venosus 120613-1]|uniref:Uncharacterized protein n=1 Tax=Choiromyces venosus 120613-1 TaxID=1336337 RepID=A0A3N4J2M7_9PEZI|nr:hypothetical protein L873DRAFT_191294 [Choiromyces venosus 120613-1]